MPDPTDPATSLRMPRLPASDKDWMRVGFFAALGTALLMLLAWLAWRLVQAALAVVAPFLIGAAFALLLDPLADRLERAGWRRPMAVGVVFGVLLLLLGVAGAVGVPALMYQAGQLAENGPRYIDNIREYTNIFLARHHRFLGAKLPANFDALSAQLSKNLTATLSQETGRVAELLLGSAATAIEAVTALIVTLYLLLDLDRLRARLFYLAPERWRRPMAVLGQDIGRVFSDYVRGLLIVSAFYGMATLGLALGLSLIHREMAGYALLVGFVGGLLYIVPYIGPLVTALVTFLVAFAAGGIGFGGIAVGLTLLLNQAFDNAITPRVIGKSVGLHPVMALFALFLGGALFGLWGLLLSVPLAASIQAVLFRLFPKLVTPTPPEFLQAEGVPPEEEQSARIVEGEDAHAAEESTEAAN